MEWNHVFILWNHKPNVSIKISLTFFNFHHFHKSKKKLIIENLIYLFSVTDSLLAARGYNTPPVSAPYLPVSSLDLVTKNFQAAAAAARFSQVSTKIKR